jgi:hypothetical protein
MPAVLRNVAKTDTLESQRQKINLLAQDVYGISSGGSDLATGNLRLGDGTLASPSLAFTSDSSLGIFKPENKAIGVVCESKSLFQFSSGSHYSYRNFTLQRKILETAGITTTAAGTFYDEGIFDIVSLLGGTGEGATATITVDGFAGSTTNAGSNYTIGAYSQQKLTGGSGSGAECTFTVEGIQGSITNPGSGYVSNTYQNVPLTNVSGSGSGAQATINVFGGIVSSINITSQGTGYLQGNVLSASAANLGGSGSGFQYTITNNPLKVKGLEISDFGSGYVSGNVLSLPAAVTGVTTTLTGNISGLTATLSTATPLVTLTSTSGLVAGMSVTTGAGSTGTLGLNTTILSVNGGTQITLSSNPTGSGAATLDFVSSTPAVITVASTANIQIGAEVTKTAGTGVLAANTTVQSIQNLTTLTLSSSPTTPGSATLSFTPTYGSGTGFAYTISAIGVVSDFSIINGGLGYIIGDTLSVAPKDLVSPVIYDVSSETYQKITFSGTIPSTNILVNDNLEVANVGAILTVNSNGTAASGTQTYTNVAPSSTSGSGINARFTISRTGGTYTIDTISVAGSGYAPADTITINGASLGGATPANNLTITIFTVVVNANLSVKEKLTSGANISFITADTTSGTLTTSMILRKVGTTTPTFTISTIDDREKYFIDLGSGPQLHPNLTIYKDSKYSFNLSSISSHPLYLSIHPDGTNNVVSGITSTLSTSSPQITVSSATGILVGMEVTKTSGTGMLVSEVSTTKVYVQAINGTTVTLSSTPTTAGAVTLSFKGAIYSGSEVTRSNSLLTITPTTTTPATLYYFCDGGSTHEDEAGLNGQEATITVNQVNPKVFGSGLILTVNDVNSEDVISSNIETGDLQALSITSDQGNFDALDIVGNTTTASLNANTATINTINSSSLDIITTTDIAITSPIVSYGTTLSIAPTSGDLTTSGVLKTTGSLNINDKLTIVDSNISSAASTDIILTPSTSRVAKVVATTALIIPAGNNSERPSGSIVANGAIRYNTDTSQYEGYSATTSSWSSLGGVRDLDGNTYIAAEATVGANDNTLYFYNDSANTLKVTPTEFIFNTLKTISSLNTVVPISVPWNANTPVTLGTYLNYGFNVYEVTIAGTTASSSSPPNHTTGSAVNGTATLLYTGSYVDDLTFGKINSVKIGDTTTPTKLTINDKLELSQNVISAIADDIVLQPFAGKKVSINSTASLVIPAGDTGQRGSPSQGSIRYSTTLSSFEGYNGTNWTSLGGVKDVDGNTYIIPESVPGGNENILYFYNNGNNTLRITQNEVLFNTLDTITSTNNNLDLNVDTVTFDNLALTIDNSVSTTSKFLSTRTNFDVALSSGLNNDPLIRLNNTGDIYINKTYGTGSNTLIKVLDNELKTFELDDVLVETSEFTLTKGTTNFALFDIFNPTLHNGAKVVLIANNVNTNDREIMEFNVVSKGTDIFHTEYGNVITSLNQVDTAFDFDASSNVRLTATLSSSVITANVVVLNVVKTIFKK